MATRFPLPALRDAGSRTPFAGSRSFSFLLSTFADSILV
jgi:hypothetical protein